MRRLKNITRISNKIVALASIFTLTFSNFAFVGKSYATGMIGLFGGNGTHENIKFDASFYDKEYSSKDIECNVNNKDLHVSLDLEVKKDGYLKDAKIEFLPKENKKLNFEIDDNFVTKETEISVREEAEAENQKIEKEKTESAIENIEAEEVKSETNEQKEEIKLEDTKTEEKGISDNTNELNELVEENMTNTLNLDDIESNSSTNEISTNTIELDLNDSNAGSDSSIVSLDMNDPEEETLVESDTTNGTENLFNSSLSLDLDDEITDLNNDNAESVERDQDGEVEKAEVEKKENENITKYEKIVEKYEDNSIYLKQLMANTSNNIQIPIRYKNDKYVDKDAFSNITSVKLSGTYIDEDGKENAIEVYSDLKLSWKDERGVRVTSSVNKYIDYGEGVILQTLVKVDNSVTENTLPVCDSQVEITVPEILNQKPKSVNVAINKLEATNGETNENMTFSKENWNYSVDDGKIKIDVKNGEISQNFYDEEGQGLKTQEYSSRYYNGSGIDEYLVTYIYPGVSSESSKYTAQEKIDVFMQIFSGIEKENNVNKITASTENEFLLEKQNGEVASLEVENMTEELSKAYFYANYIELGTYDLSIVSKYIINVANSELVDNLYFEDIQNFYIDKSGNSIDNNDLSYKEIVINRTNFEEILGLDGEIKIYDADNRALVYGVINKDSVVDTNGDMVFFVQGNISKIRFEISSPTNEGNLVIKTTKGLGNLSISKEELINMSSIITRTDFNVKYGGIEEVINLGTKNTITNLTDTITKANLTITKDRLATLSKNENVDIKIELNNDKKESDLYGHSEFEIEYPRYVDEIEILNSSLLYGEGLDISYVKNEDRKITVVIDGIQKELNSGILTNGTNIVLTANIKVNIFAPAMYESFKMKYTNSESTEYFEEGNTEAYVKYLAPSGLVGINTIRNYKDDSMFITSVMQGTKNDSINMYQEKKTANMELLLMNNNDNSVGEIKILGKFPYKGMKDCLTGEDLGNTQDIKVNPITADTNDFNIYYSDVEDPTEDLGEISNKWTEDFNSVPEVKSFLIVPKDENYKMFKADLLKFNYDFEIPANLGHGEKIVGTYKTLYENNTENGVLNEISYPDIVYLVTESGPELEVEINTDSNEVYENEEIYTSIVVRNNGEYSTKNISLNVVFPENASFVSYYSSREKELVVNRDGNGLNVSMLALEAKRDLVFDVVYKAGSYKKIPDENDDNNKIILNASVQSSDLGSVIKAKPSEIMIKKAEIIVTERNIDAEKDKTYKVGNKVPIGISIRNITKSRIDEVMFEKEIPQGVNLISIEKFENGETKEVTGNMEDGKLNIALGGLDSAGTINLECIFEISDIDSFKIMDQIKSKTIAKVNEREYSSNELVINIAKSELELTQETDSSNTYIKESEIVTYIVKIKNVGKATATNVSFEDTVPPGMAIISYSFTNEGIEHNESAVASDKIYENLLIKPDEEVVFNIKAQAQADIDSFEKSVTNEAKVNSAEQGVVSSNSITHIIEKQEKNLQDDTSSRRKDAKRRNVDAVNTENNEDNHLESEPNNNEMAAMPNNEVGSSPDIIQVAANTSNKENIERTFKISGYVWEDNNQDGVRGNGEGKIDDYNEMKVKLVNASSGVIEKELSPDETGYYVFQGVKSGEYYILLDYNTRKYGITTYKKDGVSEIVNSDIIASKVEENGLTVNKAITDKLKIESKSISNIDMGLFYAEKFDLEIENEISQIMAQTSKGMNTSNFDNVKLAKEEIAANELNGSTVYVEYTIKVKNNGDVPGYAKRIVSYILNDMEFNSGVDANGKWFSGTDGNIYTNQLSNVELKPGETREIKLVLQKKMTDENTGIVSNQVEIVDDYNNYGITDIDSIPGNHIQSEDDMSIADAIITIETGEKVIYSIFIVIAITALAIGTNMGIKKVRALREKKEEEE